MPVRASATREKFNVLVCLTQKRSPVLTYRNFVLRKLCYFYAPRPHQKWLCCFVPYGNGKSFVHVRTEKCIELLHISKAEIAEENNLPRVLEKKVSLFVDTFTYVSNCYRKNKNCCCQVVKQNNEMTSPWSNRCRMLAASRKTTTW